MTNLVKEALADAAMMKKVAVANAKSILEETFQPNTQRLVSARLAEEEDMEEEDDSIPPISLDSGDDEMDFDSEDDSAEFDDSGDDEMDFDSEGEEDLDLDAEEDTSDEMDDEMELESLIREMEDDEFSEYEDEGDDEMDDEMELESLIREMEDDEFSEYEDEGDDEMDDITAEAILRELEGEDDEEEMYSESAIFAENKKLKRENRKLRNNLNESYQALTTVKNALNEINLLNSKLMHSTKIFKNYELNEQKQMNVLETFDRATNIKEVKLLYSAFEQSLSAFKRGKKINKLTEGVASRPMLAQKAVVKDSYVPRFQKLAGIIPTYE
jgi:hypothetical protein